VLLTSLLGHLNVVFSVFSLLAMIARVVTEHYAAKFQITPGE